MQTRTKAICAGIIAASAAFVPLFALFDRALITYWKWEHDGRKMMFTLWADERAFSAALALCALVFYASVRYFHRRAPLDQRINRRSLVIAGVSAVIVVYIFIVAYVSTVVSRFPSSR